MDIPRKQDLKRIKEYLWEIPRDFRHDMKVPARIYASEKMLDSLFKDRSLWQLVNTAAMPGIVRYSVVMPDAHEGYGFPIGGVVAMNIKSGLISPGGVGYDINCGVRLLKSNFYFEDLKEKLKELANQIYINVPSGVGRGGFLKLDRSSFDKVMTNGAEFMVNKGYGEKEDLNHIESGGCLKDANPEAVSIKARNRGFDQLGTIGAGNHFIEIQKVDQIFFEEAAEVLGIFKNQICVMIHTGSRGFGHQIATDYIRKFMLAMVKYGIKLPDRELAAAPFSSEEGQQYWQAMSAGANFAWANRQLITHMIRKAWEKVLNINPEDLKIVYDVAHNIGKKENHLDEKGNRIEVLVHRKGATRAFGPGNIEVPEDYRKIGQPVIIPGSMGTASYILVGTNQTMEETFGSSCHGAGRVMSRSKAKRIIHGASLKRELERRGIIIKAGSMSGLAEEAPEAYKDVDSVVDVVHGAGIAKRVARLVPVAVIKG